MATNFIRKYPYNIVKVGTHFFGILEKETNKMIMKPADKEGEKDKVLLFNSYTKALDHVKAINESKKALKHEEKKEKEAPKVKLKKFQIHITQVCEQDYEIKARTEEEAKQIAEDKYMDNELDPIRDEGDISHYVRLTGESNEKDLHEKYWGGYIRDLKDCGAVPEGADEAKLIEKITNSDPMWQSIDEHISTFGNELVKKTKKAEPKQEKEEPEIEEDEREL